MDERQHKAAIMRKKRNNRILGRIKLSISLVILLAIILLAISATPICRIEQISYSGQNYDNDAEISQYVSDLVGQNLLQGMNYNPIDLAKMRFVQQEKQIQKLPYVKSVTVKYKPLHEVAVEVVGRVPISLIETANKFLLVDDDGMLLENYSDKTDPALAGKMSNYILLSGIDPTGYSRGRLLPAEVLGTYKNVAAIIGAFKEYDNLKATTHTKEITVVNASNPDNIVINYNNTIDIYFSSNTDFVYKAGFICKMLDDNLIGNEKGKLKYNESKGSFSFIPN